MSDYEQLERHRLMQIDENRYVSKRMDEQEKCIVALQSLVNDLRWRMNEVCNLLQLKREEVGNTPTASCCSAHVGGYEECKPQSTGYDKIPTVSDYECQHESDGKLYANYDFSNSQPYKCTKCGEFYR